MRGVKPIIPKRWDAGMNDLAGSGRRTIAQVTKAALNTVMALVFASRAQLRSTSGVTASVDLLLLAEAPGQTYPP